VTTCCDHCQDTSTLFDREKAEGELRDYRKNDAPPNKPTRLLTDGLKSLDLQDKRLLDVGGGVGMISWELFEEGLSESTLVETSPAYVDVAEEESRRRGYAEATSVRRGDFVEMASEFSDADLVTLDRVICCYPHMKRLVRASTAKASRWYGVTYPRETWYNQVIGQLADVYCWARGMDFRMHIHSGVEEAIRAEGFVPFYQVNTVLWRVALYERTSTSG
jgi:magnesium-protoporphyrin O-methyltransferase